jgi:hypothetical protein
MVRPLIDFLDPAKIGTYSVGDWRSFYNPTNRAAFFASYQSMIVAVAQAAQTNGATMLCIGVELDQLAGPANLTYWTDIVTAVRAAFSGTLVYSANWDAAISPWQGQHGLTAGTGDLTTQISFWSALDFVGIDEYAPLSDKASPVLGDLIAGWTQVPSDQTALAVTGNQSLISYFDGVAAKIGKPLFFTEIGYESANDAALDPAGSSTNVYDPALQANLYAAFFDAWQQNGNGALTGVLFWNWDPNAAEVGPGNGANFSPQALPAQRVATAAFTGRAVNAVMTATHDFNGDGMSDIAWRDGSGNTSSWLMNAASVISGTGFGEIPASWRLAGQRDLDGDGKTDWLWLDSAGDLAVWFLNGAAVSSTAAVGAVGSAWSITATGDFNGDGDGDILWRDTSGNLAIWLMNGSAVASSASLGQIPLTWSVAGLADFNGDRMSDILWRDASGDTAIWFMNGTQVASSAGVGNLPTAWAIIGTGDFNGDGSGDMLLRDGSGNTLLWLMNGAQVASTAALGVVPATWSAAATGDYDGDGASDILWRDGSGNTAIWFTNGGTIASGVSIGNVPISFTVQSANAE